MSWEVLQSEYYWDENRGWQDSISNWKKGTSTIIARLEKELWWSDTWRTLLWALNKIREEVAWEIDFLLSLKDKIDELRTLISEYTISLLEGFLNKRVWELPKPKILKTSPNTKKIL